MACNQKLIWLIVLCSLDLQYEDRGCIDPAIRILIGVARKNYSLVFVVISYLGVKFAGDKIC